MILDTSVLFDSLVSAPLSAQARDLLTSDVALRSPDLILIEIAGAITRSVRRREIKAETAGKMLARAQRLAPATNPSGPFIDRAFVLSMDLNHPLADCIFLAQAEAQADVLVTSDERLIRKLAGTPYAARAVHIAEWRP